MNEFWWMSSGLYRKAQGKACTQACREQKERSVIDGLWCIYRTVMRKFKA